MALTDPPRPPRPSDSAGSERGTKTHRLNSIDAGLDQLRSELRTQRGQLIGVTVMVALLGIMLAASHQQVLAAIANE
jgi:hypothetical protein